ncbi:MAG: hypothetical protein AAGA22_08725 [Pseudomonadota bacterium]
MLKTTALLIAGSTMIMGVAQAEPLTLTDGQMDVVSAAGPANIDANKRVNIDERINKDVYIKKHKDIYQRVDLFGFYSDADGAANCFGAHCETLTFAITDTNALEYYSTSVSGSESSAMPFVYDRRRKDIDHPKPTR